jgi:hypothetical protein
MHFVNISMRFISYPSSTINQDDDLSLVYIVFR